jgi:hypothetical protein
MEHLRVLSEIQQIQLMTRTINERAIGESGNDFLGKDPGNLVAIFRAMVGSQDKQDLDELNLRSGMRLLTLYPSTAGITCESCQKFWMDPIDGTYAKRDGVRLERPEGSLLCEVGTCPAGDPNANRRLNRKNLMAYRHYLECYAVGDFPEDPIVRNNARLISWSIDRAKSDQRKARQACPTQ